MRPEWILFYVLIPGGEVTPLNQGISSMCIYHALANTVADELNEEYQIGINPTCLSNILVSYNEHFGTVWPDESDNYPNPLTTLDIKTEGWISIKMKTVKRVKKFSNAKRHVLAYDTKEVWDKLVNNLCFFFEKTVRRVVQLCEQLGRLW